MISVRNKVSRTRRYPKCLRPRSNSVSGALRGRANRRVAYVTSGSQKAVQPPLELPCVKSCAPIGASSKHARVEHSHHHTHSQGGHTHSHPPADGSKITWRRLMVLGVSGGLVPCPAALVLLLGAISLG